MSRLPISDMTVDTFPVSSSNQQVFQRCTQMLLQPERQWLMFLSLPSNERFHMKWAILHAWKDLDIRYASVSDFADSLVAAIRSGAPLHGEEYLGPWILLLDDLELLEGRYATQLELSSLLKKRMDSGKSTVILSEYPLDALLSFGAELLSLLHQRPID